MRTTTSIAWLRSGLERGSRHRRGGLFLPQRGEWMGPGGAAGGEIGGGGGNDSDP